MAKQRKFWNKTTLVSLLIVFLMVSSTAGFIFGRDADETAKYNGFKFTRTEQGWITKVNGEQFAFYYHPLELTGLNISSDIFEMLKQPQVHITFEVTKKPQFMDVARFELSYTMLYLNIYPSSGVLDESEIYDFPVIDCGNATASFPVLKFILGNETNVHAEDNCVVAQAVSETDFIAISDKLRYGLLGVYNGK